MKKDILNIKKDKKIGEKIFIFTALLFPLSQFFIFYICVNINSILFSFKSYVGADTYVFAGFSNFVQVIKDFATQWEMQIVLKNSLIMWFFNTPLMILATVIIAYSIWKKVYFSKFFSVILFLPSIISSVVFVLIARIFIINVFPDADLLSYSNGFMTVLIIGWCLGFGSKIIYFLGAMSGISPEIVESAKLEGVNAFQEFIHIVVPGIYQTLISLIVLGFAHIFVDQGLILTFFGTAADYRLRTIGYHIYVQIYSSVNYADYPYIAAMGLLFTGITIPIVFTVKWAMEKFGPRED